MKKIIVALDEMDYEQAISLAQKLKEAEVIFKINDLLDDRDGPSIIWKTKHFGDVMADPKFHDIPNTVKNRVKKYVGFKPDFITVHASGGVAMMRAAVENCEESKILAVTVLTSLFLKP